MDLTVGVDLGGTKIAVGVVDESGAILHSVRRDTPARSAGAVVDVIVDAIAEVRGSYEVGAVGIGAAGLIDAARSRVLFAPNLGWVDQPLAREVSAGCGLPTIVDNDANTAAWGEYRFGAGVGVEHLVMVTVGTGIGGGVIVGGSLLRGAHGVAAEIGHINVVPGGRPCGCGLRGCWEQYASGHALVREARHLAAERRTEASELLALGDGSPEGVQGRHVTEAAIAGNPVAQSAFAALGMWLGRGMADLAVVLDPGAFVLGGGVSESGELLLNPARASFNEHLMARDYRPLPAMQLAKLGNSAGLIGAADLARHLA